MKKRQNLFMVMGAPSLFLIFSVLCMAILGLLTLGTSRTDLKMSKASLEQTSLYNEAVSRATEMCLEIESALTEAGKQAADEEAYFALAEEIAKETEGGFWEKELRRIVFDRKITEEQSLRVELQVLKPGGESSLRLVSWKTVVSDTWEPELHQPVFKGE